MSDQHPVLDVVPATTSIGAGDVSLRTVASPALPHEVRFAVDWLQRAALPLPMGSLEPGLHLARLVGGGQWLVEALLHLLGHQADGTPVPVGPSTGPDGLLPCGCHRDENDGKCLSEAHRVQRARAAS